MQLAVTLNFWSLCLCFISAGVLGLHHHARFMACWDQTRVSPVLGKYSTLTEL